MLKTATLTVAIAAMSALFALDASALPLAAAKQQAAVESQLTLVRDGCGRGMRFSNHRQSCVEDFQSQPQIRVIRAECPHGWHFSNRERGCVRNNPVRVLLNALGGNDHNNNNNHRRYRD